MMRIADLDLAVKRIDREAPALLDPGLHYHGAQWTWPSEPDTPLIIGFGACRGEGERRLSNGVRTLFDDDLTDDMVTRLIERGAKNLNAFFASHPEKDA